MHTLMHSNDTFSMTPLDMLSNVRTGHKCLQQCCCQLHTVHSGVMGEGGDLRTLKCILPDSAGGGLKS